MKEALRDFGLSENEITIYLSSLKIGSGSANQIASLSGLKRSTCYDTLNSLTNKGLISRVKKEGVQQYSPLPPKKLLHLLEQKTQRIKSILPALEKLHQEPTQREGVVYYEGKKGVLAVVNDILDSSPKKIFYLGSRQHAKLPLQHYPDNFVRRRVELKIRAEGILAQEDTKDSFLDEAKAHKLSQFSYSSKLNDSTANIFVYDSNVAFITNSQDPVGVIIKNAKIATQMKILFSLLKD